MRLYILLCAYFAVPSFAIWTMEGFWVKNGEQKVTYFTLGGKSKNYTEKRVTVGYGHNCTFALTYNKEFCENLLEDLKKITDNFSELSSRNIVILLSILIIGVLLFKAFQMSLGKKDTSKRKETKRKTL